MAEEDFKINMLKSFTKEQRQQMVRALNRDPEMYNAVNGIGGLSESANHGLLQGTTYAGEDILTGVQVIINTGGKTHATVRTNQYGYYSVNLAAATYSVVFSHTEGQSDPAEVIIKNGTTSTLDYDSEAVPEPPKPPEEGGGA